MQLQGQQVLQAVHKIPPQEDWIICETFEQRYFLRVAFEQPSSIIQLKPYNLILINNEEDGNDGFNKERW